MPFSTFGQALGLSDELVRAAVELGFHSPTPVQSAAIPPALRGTDLMASAQTGSGKTAAFALPLIARLSRMARPSQRWPRALVLVPTRELAAQVGEVVRALAQHRSERLKVSVVFGGVSINPQMMAMRGGTDVVVATPGRLLDLVAHRAVNLSHASLLVLDEADRLLDLGFADELHRVLALLPADRQTLMFSATFPPPVAALAQTLLKNPVLVEVPDSACTETATERAIAQRAILVDAPRRTQLLRHLIQCHQWQRVLVFVATQHAAGVVAEKLYKAGVYATPFHGGLSQGARQQVLEEFKDERWEVVVTTDLAARGIDIAQLPVVVNYDLPRSAVDHVHRIGRTGRAGAKGLAVSFVTAASEAHFRLIEKRQGLTLPRENIPGFEVTEVPPTSAGHGGVKGKRPSKKDKLRAVAAAVSVEPPATRTA